MIKVQTLRWESVLYYSEGPNVITCFCRDAFPAVLGAIMKELKRIVSILEPQKESSSANALILGLLTCRAET